ncbi:MAG: hypothetical protein M1824_005237 [Vezdaea acicularis]|nr:MAG: hypothetical protein M1824_005237 [Vezdaea acicularis]
MTDRNERPPLSRSDSNQNDGDAIELERVVFETADSAAHTPPQNVDDNISPLSSPPIGSGRRSSGGGRTREGSGNNFPPPIPEREETEDTEDTEETEDTLPSRVARGSDASSTPSPGWERRASTAPSMVARTRQTSQSSQLGLTRAETGISHASSPAPVATHDTLLDFNRVVAADGASTSDSLRERREYVREQMDEMAHHKVTLDELRSFKDHEKVRWQSIHKTLASKFGIRRGPSMPSDEKIISMAQYYYPPRGMVRVDVCDFGPERAEHFQTTLGDIQQQWETKPDWATVRWIHAPLGIGLVHSSVEDLFLNDGKRRCNGKRGYEFKHGGRAGWPYIECEVLNIRSQEYFQDYRDAMLLLRRYPHITEKLDPTVFKGDKNQDLKSDIEWRADHVNGPMGYWDLAASDMPWQLDEGLGAGLHGPHAGLKPLSRKVTPQLLSRNPFFKHAQIVRDPFRAFHRADGCLLTMSPAAGINYLDKNMNDYLKEPPHCRFDNEHTSAIGNVWKEFSNTGTDTWHKKTVEWFMVYLMTEIEATPNNIRQGYNAPSMQDAYQPVVQDLKRRRYETFKKNESIKLVRDYNSCMDEISSIVNILEHKVSFLDRLKKDCAGLESTARPLPPHSATARVDWARTAVSDNLRMMRGLLDDLQGSLSALFQLRTIEQNELAIVADSQNKAILVFSITTVIFLPLSFFTSYFGMNLQGIVGTSHGQGFFWTVTASFAFVIVATAAILAFRKQVYAYLWGNQRLTDEEQ